MGPAFKRNYKFTEALPNVNIYSLMCHILNLTPAPNNGSLLHVRHMLVDGPNKGSNGSGGLRITEMACKFCFIKKKLEIKGLLLVFKYYIRSL